MRYLWLWLMLLLVSGVQAAGIKQAVVLEVRGKGHVSLPDDSSVPLFTGQVLQEGATVSLDPQASAVLLLLPEGNRVLLSGSKPVLLTAKGLQGGTLAPITGPQVTVTARAGLHAAGETVRGSTQAVPESPYQDFHVEIGKPSGKVCPVTLRWSGSQPVPLQVKACEGFYERHWSRVGNDLEVEGQAEISWDQVPGQTARPGADATYKVQLQLAVSSEPYSIKVGPMGQESALLTTRIRVLSDAERQQLEASLAQLSQWISQDPNSTQARVALMVLYDSVDRVEEALQAGQEALKLTPTDPGLLLCLSQLALDSGHLKQSRDYQVQAQKLMP